WRYDHSVQLQQAGYFDSEVACDFIRVGRCDHAMREQSGGIRSLSTADDADDACAGSGYGEEAQQCMLMDCVSDIFELHHQVFPLGGKGGELSAELFSESGEALGFGCGDVDAELLLGVGE